MKIVFIKRAFNALYLMLILLVSVFSVTIAADMGYESIEITLEAEGNGLILWGAIRGAPFPGEPFFYGAPDNPIPILQGFGEPMYSEPLTSSSLRFTAKSNNITEIPVRPGDPPGNPAEYALPGSLTKLWMEPLQGMGSLEATWMHDEETHILDIEFSAEQSLGTWVGSPASCDWGFLALGGPNPVILPFLNFPFTGNLDGSSITGNLGTLSWPDHISIDVYIDGEEGTYLSFWWTPDILDSHPWFTYWLDYDIEVQNYGYGDGQDPLVTWISPASHYYRCINVDGFKTETYNQQKLLGTIDELNFDIEKKSVEYSDTIDTLKGQLDSLITTNSELEETILTLESDNEESSVKSSLLERDNEELLSKISSTRNSSYLAYAIAIIGLLAAVIMYIKK